MELALAARLVGGAGGASGVVAQDVSEKADGGTPAPPIARTW